MVLWRPSRSPLLHLTASASRWGTPLGATTYTYDSRPPPDEGDAQGTLTYTYDQARNLASIVPRTWAAFVDYTYRC